MLPRLTHRQTIYVVATSANDDFIFYHKLWCFKGSENWAICVQVIDCLRFQTVGNYHKCFFKEYYEDTCCSLCNSRKTETFRKLLWCHGVNVCSGHWCRSGLHRPCWLRLRYETAPLEQLHFARWARHSSADSIPTTSAGSSRRYSVGRQF